MASLTDVYEGHLRTVTTSRRVTLGASTFAVGTATVVGSIVVATTDVGAQFGLGLYEARELAGVLAGFGLPAALLGVFTVLPAGRATRSASVIGASVSVFGVSLFVVAYPYQWFGSGDGILALASLLAYFAGTITTLGCLFVGLATFRTRNEPGGTARMEITETGQVRLVEEADPAPPSALGSVGLFGRGPAGDVTTQTNRDSPPRECEPDSSTSAEIIDSDGSRSRDRSRPSAGTATADGGSTTVDGGDGLEPPEDDAEFIDSATGRGRPDAYCGNCAHFEYVKVEGEITPYCGRHDELMEDMDPCDQWTGRQ
jgi:hypothetical protein